MRSVNNEESGENAEELMIQEAEGIHKYVHLNIKSHGGIISIIIVILPKIREEFCCFTRINMKKSRITFLICPRNTRPAQRK